MQFEWLNKQNYRQMKEIKEEVFKNDSCRYFESDIYENIVKNKREYLSSYGDINSAIIKVDNIAVGVIGYYTDIHRIGEEVWLGFYGIMEPYRNHGFGFKSLTSFIDFLKYKYPNLKRIRLYTGTEENKEAIKLYKKLGFTDIKETKNLIYR